MLYYVLMVAGALATQSHRPSIQAIVKVGSKLDERILNESLTFVKPFYEQLGATDKVAKGKLLLPKINEALDKRLGASPALAAVAP